MDPHCFGIESSRNEIDKGDIFLALILIPSLDPDPDQPETSLKCDGKVWIWIRICIAINADPKH